MKGPLFFAKILLLKYGIIKDSEAFHSHNFYRVLKLNANGAFLDSHEKLNAFCAYLRHFRNDCSFRLGDLESDLNQKMYFDSSIPQGSVGSSGAICGNLRSVRTRKITVLENLLKKNYCVKRFFHRIVFSCELVRLGSTE